MANALESLQGLFVTSEIVGVLDGKSGRLDRQLLFSDRKHPWVLVDGFVPDRHARAPGDRLLFTE